VRKRGRSPVRSTAWSPRRQLRALGYTPSAIDHRLSTGRLHLVRRGIYAVGWPGSTPLRRWSAALLACGEGAALSHQSAAGLWRIGEERSGVVDVSVRRHCDLRLIGIHARSRTSLPTADILTRHGIPVTTPVRTLVDVATELTDNRLERAVNEADKHDLVDPETLRAALDAYAGQPGARRLRTLLDRHTFRLSDSDLEILFRPIAARAGLPPPLSKQWVLGFEVDFHWPSLGLVVETDGLRYHRTPAQQARAARRDQTHTAAGLRTLRFTHYQVKYEPAHVRTILNRTRCLLDP